MGIGSNFAILATGFAILNVLIVLVSLGFAIYVFILFIKLARRGIVALDIYNKKNDKEI